MKYKSKNREIRKYKRLNIFYNFINVLIFLMVIFGIIFSLIDSKTAVLVCSGGETLIENCIYHYGTFMTKNPFLNWFIWFAIIFLPVLAFRLLINYLKGRNTKEKDDLSYKSKEKFERNVSACDYRKWSK